MTISEHHVFWTQTAQQDLKKIIEYIAADSDIRARQVYLAIKQKADNLRQMPLQGRIVPELRYYSILIYRELISPPWRIIYRTDENKVWVLAVIDARRNIEDILLERFISNNLLPTSGPWSELVQLKLNIESSVGESTPTEAEYGVPLPLVEVGVSRLDEY